MGAPLRQRLSGLMPRDQRRLQRRLDGARKVKDTAARQRVLDEITEEIARAELRVEQRRSAVPKITYPAELPISQRRQEILDAIRDNQVVIVAGETGSG